MSDVTEEISPEIQEILDAHRLWVQSQGAWGQRANLIGRKLKLDEHGPGAQLQSADLRGAILKNAQLQGADLSNARLQGTNLSGAHLQGALLEHARLHASVWTKIQALVRREEQRKKADLRNARLQGANLVGAELRNIRLQRAQLQGADLRRAKLQRANLDGIQLEGSDLRGTCLKGAKTLSLDQLRYASKQGAILSKTQRAQLETPQGPDNSAARNQPDPLVTKLNNHREWVDSGCRGKPPSNPHGARLSGRDLRGAKLQHADFIGANLNGADLQGANLNGANLQGANLTGANLQGAKLKGANLNGANLRGTQLQGANLSNANLKRAWLRDACLSGAKLENTDLAEAQLQNAKLIRTQLQGANLWHAELHGANLWKAQLWRAKLFEVVFGQKETSGADSVNPQGGTGAGEAPKVADLSNADFRDADLSGAILNGARGFPVTLAGSVLTNAKLSTDVAKFETLAHVQKTSQNAQTTFFALLAACLYSWLTIWTTNDSDLFTGTASSQLPIISTPILVSWFYWVAPFVLLAVYCYLLLYLQRLWEGLAPLPAIFPDGEALDDKAYPWLLTGFARPYFKRHSPRSLIRDEKGLAILLAWGLVPLTLIFFWLRYLPAHDESGTALQFAALAFASWYGMRTYQLAIWTLRGPLWQAEKRQTETQWNKALRTVRRLRTNRHVGPWLVTLVVTLVVMLVWLSARCNLVGSEFLGLKYPCVAFHSSLTGSLPHFPKYYGTADLRDAEISIKPSNWTGVDEESLAAEIAQVKGADLSELDLREVDASGAFLVKARLEDADLRRANLSSADLREAKLQRAQLQDADLSSADLRGANLSGANICGANLRGAIWQNVAREVQSKPQAQASISDVYVCTSPPPDKEPIDQRKEGEWVTVLGEEEGWAKVRLGDGREAYVASNLLSTDAPAAGPPICKRRRENPSGVAAGLSCRGGAKVRRKAKPFGPCQGGRRRDEGRGFVCAGSASGLCGGDEPTWCGPIFRDRPTHRGQDDALFGAARLSAEPTAGAAEARPVHRDHRSDSGRRCLGAGQAAAYGEADLRAAA